jgi:hypothetical protein
MTQFRGATRRRRDTMADVEFANRRDRFGVPMVVIDGVRYKESDLHKAHKARLPQDLEGMVTRLFEAPEAAQAESDAPEPTVDPEANPLLVPLAHDADYATIKQRVEDLGLQTPTQKKVDLLAGLDAYYGGL